MIRLFGNRRGQAGLFMVLNLGLILGAIGLAVDIGWAYFTKIRIQAAADAAAMAGASYASNGGPITCGTGGATCTGSKNCDSSVTSATDSYTDGCLYAKYNGYVSSGTTTVTMTGNSGSAQAPPGTTGNTPTYWVQANITTKPYTLFGPFGGLRQLQISASSVAAVSYYSVGACIYVLDSSASQAFLASGASTTTATCGIFVASNSSSAFTETGSAHVTASQITVKGGTALGSSTSVSPTPTTGVSTTDPLASQSEPTLTQSQVRACDFSNKSYGSTTVASIPAGVYCGGLTISNSANITFDTSNGKDFLINGGLSIGGAAHATFQPGLYIINGSSSNVGVSFGNSAVVNGTGVTFYITGQYSDSGNHAYTVGNVQMTGATTVNLSAPHSGTYAGMLFLQDRTLTYSGVNSFANSASSILQGTLYFPTTSMTYSGASATGTYTAVVADKISFTGSAAFKNDPSGFYTGLGTTVRGIIQ